MLTDSLGQNVPYPSEYDAPNAQTLGQGIVENLNPRTVLVYASASVRGATITTPVAGMVSWLQDTKSLEVYDGTIWTSIASGSSAWTDIPLASGFTANGNSNGTPQYRLANLFGEPTLMFRGGVGVTYPSGSIANGGVINSTPLPTALRPSTLRTITIASSLQGSTSASLKLDVQTGGNLLVVGTNGSTVQPVWVSLNGTFVSL